jgi:hypothetical protein
VDLRIYCEGPDSFRICNVTPEARQERFLQKLSNYEARNVLYDLPAILNARRTGDST